MLGWEPSKNRRSGVSNRCELAFLRTVQELIMNDRAPREIGRPRRIALQKVLCGLPIYAVQIVHPALKTSTLLSPKVPSLRDSGHHWAWGNMGFHSLRELHPRLFTDVTTDVVSRGTMFHSVWPREGLGICRKGTR